MVCEVKISGAKCQKCVDKIERFVGEIDGVELIEVDLKAQLVRVESAESAGNLREKIVAAIDEAGFEVAQ